MTPPSAQLAIEDLARENHVLHEHIASLEADVDVYRALAQEAMTRCFELTTRIRSLQVRTHALIETIRTMRTEAATRAAA